MFLFFRHGLADAFRFPLKPPSPCRLPQSLRLPKCGTQQISRELGAGLSLELREVLEPLFQEIESLNERIKEYDRRIEKTAKEIYPETELLKQVKGIGDLIALTYVLDDRGPVPISEEPRSGMLFGAATWTLELRRERTTDAHQQGG